MYDLHTHSVCSDGAATPEEISLYAKERGLSGFALTDHDTICGIAEAKESSLQYGIDVLGGSEISAFDPMTGRKVHLLVYLPSHSDALTKIFERVSVSRERACLMAIEVLKDKYHITEGDVRRFSDGASLFRTHIMRALMERGYADRVFGELYHELFSKKGGSAYFPVDYVPMEEAAAAARDSGGVTVLAHPGVYDSFDAGMRLCKMGLVDGIEYFYPRRKSSDIPKLDLLAETFSLIKTGGTDFHGFHSTPPHPIGTCTTECKTVSKIKEISEKRR